jgi:hypothetical protein
VEGMQVADRVRVASSRKRAGARRPAKKKRMRRLGILGLAALAMLILGFLAKRIMIPSAVHYIAYRAPDAPQANPPGASEELTPADQRELDAIIKRKAK